MKVGVDVKSWSRNWPHCIVRRETSRREKLLLFKTVVETRRALGNGLRVNLLLRIVATPLTFESMYVITCKWEKYYLNEEGSVWQQVPMTSWQIISVLFLQENKTFKLTNNMIHLQSLNYSDRFFWFEVNLLYHASEQKELKKTSRIWKFNVYHF